MAEQQEELAAAGRDGITVEGGRRQPVWPGLNRRRSARLAHICMCMRNSVVEMRRICMVFSMITKASSCAMSRHPGTCGDLGNTSKGRNRDRAHVAKLLMQNDHLM